MNIIDGKKTAFEIKEELKAEIAALKAKGVTPGLATILVGDDPASKVYIASKIKACGDLGIRSFHYGLGPSSQEQEIIALISKINADSRVHGILLQLPLPKGLSQEKCLDAIAPQKDVDGLHPYNIGRLFCAKSWDEIEKNKYFVPCTPLGIITLLNKYGINVSGKNAMVIGRSNLVGKPIAMLLLANNATVTLAHSKTEDLEKLCSKADIIVAAIGKERFVKEGFVKKGAIIIDVGMNRSEDGLCGDVDFEAVKEKAGFITPVPGGVGPMTITMLMKNTVLAAEKE